MYYFSGGSATTAFQQARLLAELQALQPEVSDLVVTHHFVLDYQGECDASVLSQLAALLPNGAYEADPTAFVGPTQFWVTPRLGTISPWSSKATEILQRCGFTKALRLERIAHYQVTGLQDARLRGLCFDPLTQSVVTHLEELSRLFLHDTPKPDVEIDLLEQGESALVCANKDLGLALSAEDKAYLLQAYRTLNRNPTDVELMMFAQVNSEHCRHKIFNANWWLDGKAESQSLFSMIRHTYHSHPEQAIVAYKDNAAVLRGHSAWRYYPAPKGKQYLAEKALQHIVLKVETHNHPTAISPFAGAATGSGGEIRDEAATGRAAQAKAGLCGFSVSNLQIPDYRQPWEAITSQPAHLASPLEIMLQGPIGAAAFNNEFGRANIAGYFRTFEMQVPGYYDAQRWGYQKPIMIAGGIGAIVDAQVEKRDIPASALLVVLGGPGMAIGLGGGAASSRASGDDQTALDFASVQRANPEMQRRCQEVINACRDLGDDNPILSIHDVGAGGLSNALPELVEACGLGATIDLRRILIDEPGMTPAEIWCNESQERYVLAMMPASLPVFESICRRERCPFSVVGEATEGATLRVSDPVFHNHPVDLPMSTLFQDMPKLRCESEHLAVKHAPFSTKKIDLTEAIMRVLQFPCVASKAFLITIGDRSVGGLIARDQMIGPWQVPVSDVGVTATDFRGYAGEAMALGERPPVALLHPAASARLAVAEAITNLAAAKIAHLSDVALSANWMAAASTMGEGAALYDAVEAIAMEMCPALGISIPVGKDSLSMQTAWQTPEGKETVTSPLSLVITAAAPVTDVRKTLTPLLHREIADTRLLLIDLGDGANALGASVLAQVYGELGDSPADVSHIQSLKQLFEAIQDLNQRDLILAYHDRSDGGLIVTLLEMMFCSHVGLTVDVSGLGDQPITALFTEEVGVVIQVDAQKLPMIYAILERYQLRNMTHVVAELNASDECVIVNDGDILFQETRLHLQRTWSETSYRLQRLRDNPETADQEFESLSDTKDPGLQCQLTYDPGASVISGLCASPRVAILREQGVNGHIEMAAAFMAAGFTCVDVHMNDLLDASVNLADFVGLAACGGFSYGDVLGAGQGWAQSILRHDQLRLMFETFFKRPDTFTLGVCNGCQMLSGLRDIIAGAACWPTFHRNVSEQFEARLSQVRVESSPSIFFRGMVGSTMPVVVSHGEGQAVFHRMQDLSRVNKDELVALRFVDYQGEPTERYPANPNGSLQGMTGFTTPDGRVTMMMPHPERVFRTLQYAWHPADWGEESPWLRLFQNARLFVG